MKKTLIALVLTGLSFTAVAQHTGSFSPDGQGHTQGGFKGPAQGVSSVAQAKRLRDDAWVVLEGNIVRQVGHELYEFSDQSGTIYIDLDDQHWMGQTPSSRDKVRIEGEIDRDMTSLEVDVKNIHVLK